jgi:hypothetical protein
MASAPGGSLNVKTIMLKINGKDVQCYLTRDEHHIVFTNHTNPAGVQVKMVLGVADVDQNETVRSISKEIPDHIREVIRGRGWYTHDSNQTGPNIPNNMPGPAPQSGYMPPQQQNYAPPQQNYAPPPQQNYAPPPQQNYAPPPQQNYAPPPQQNAGPGYQPPSQGYNPQQNAGPGYQPPQQNANPGYQPPQQQNANPGYQPPQQQNAGPGYQPPQQNANPGYQPPQQQNANPGYQPPQPQQGYMPQSQQNFAPQPNSQQGYQSPSTQAGPGSQPNFSNNVPMMPTTGAPVMPTNPPMPTNETAIGVNPIPPISDSKPEPEVAEAHD